MARRSRKRHRCRRASPVDLQHHQRSPAGQPRHHCSRKALPANRLGGFTRPVTTVQCTLVVYLCSDAFCNCPISHVPPLLFLPNSRTKMRVLMTNPAIYQRFREGSESFYTHWGVGYYLQYFLDHDLRIPELKEEILTHPLNRSPSAIGGGGGGLLAYLTGESSPQSSKKKSRSGSLSPPSATSRTTAHKLLLVDALTLPNLERTDRSSDDDSDGIMSLESRSGSCSRISL